MTLDPTATFFPFPEALSSTYSAAQLIPMRKYDYKTGDPLPINPAEMREIDAKEHRQAQTDEEVSKKLTKAFERARAQQLRAQGDREIGGGRPLIGASSVVLEEGAIVSDWGARPYMEDYADVDGDISIVCDGHGPPERGCFTPGSYCAKFVVKNLPSLVRARLGEGETDREVFNALRSAFVQVGRAYSKVGGTTANLVWQRGDILWCANVGDSRAIVVTAGATIQLSADADMKDSYFRKKVRNRFGLAVHLDVWRVDGYTAMASALGDHHMLGHVSQLPNVTKWQVPEEDREFCYLVQASDGLFNAATTNQVGEYVRKRFQEGIDPEGIAIELVNDAKQQFPKTADNIIVVIKRVSTSFFEGKKDEV